MELSLTESTIRRLAKDSSVTREFPFLLPYGKKSQASCCGKVSYPDTNPAVAAIIGLPPDRKARFKAVTGASSVVGRVVRAAKLVKVSF
jgi:hypothetical protein